MGYDSIVNNPRCCLRCRAKIFCLQPYFSFFASASAFTLFPDSATLTAGRLAYRGVSKETGQLILEQKRVDIQLVVDMLTLAFSRQIATAILVAGDSDFIPAVCACKDQGVRVVLYHGQRNPAHRDLLACADQRLVMDQAMINKVRRR